MKNSNPLFLLSVDLSNRLVSGINAAESCDGDFGDRIHSILEYKKGFRASTEYKDLLSKLGEDFTIDGAVKIDVNKLKDDFSITPGLDFDKVMDNLQHFVVSTGGSLVFRSPEYYFLFKGITVEGIDGDTSINDFSITEIDIHSFLEKLNIHLNGAYQTLRLFRHYIHSMAQHSLLKSEKRVLRRVEKIFSKTLYNKISRKSDYTAFNILQEYRLVIEEFFIAPSLDSYYKMLHFIIQHRINLTLFSALYEEDFIGFLDFYIDIPLPHEVRKLILGLVDAKINIFSFFQNLDQILTNDQFLDTDTKGRLVFNNQQARSIQNCNPEKFSEFHKQKQEYKKGRRSRFNFATYLEYNVADYIDIMLGDSNIGLLVQSNMTPTPNDLKSESYGEDDTVPYIMRETQDLLMRLMEMFESYTHKYEQRNVKQRKKHIKKNGTDEGFRGNDFHAILKQQALNKLIRLFREEDNPLTIIGTVENSFHDLTNKGFDITYHYLYTLGVNYGGSLIGDFARVIIPRLVGLRGGFTEKGNILYSLYDVKNADRFSTFSEYPSSGLYSSDGENEKMPKNRDRNWMVIYDDNTHSGETLHNLSELAEQSKCFGHIDTYACRVGEDLKKRSKKVSDDMVLQHFGKSASELRQVKSGRDGERYKELIGSVIGRKVHRNQKNKIVIL